MSSASFAGFRVLHPAYVEDSDPLQLQQLSIFFQGNLGIIQVLPIRPEKKSNQMLPKHCSWWESS
jgi:hypothetical protein